MAVSKKVKPFKIGGVTVQKGERKKIFLDGASLYDYTSLNIPVEVIRGKKDGPTLFISAAIHGDEINGVEIIKRLLQKPFLQKISGTLIAVPVVNVFGFNSKSRYLPDRRDLNRSFPGNSKGSFAARLANIFMKEVVNKCTHGIDLHTGAIYRTNLPQIRACLDDAPTSALAKSFGVPVVLHSQLKDGSLREAARKRGIKTLLFEGGEALRFDEDVIKVGLNGCISVMREIGILAPKKSARASQKAASYVAKGSHWIRAPHGGTFRTLKRLGDRVKEREQLAIISDPFGGEPYEVLAQEPGIIIGQATIPLVNRGEAMFHVATFKNSVNVKKAIDLFDNEMSE